MSPSDKVKYKEMADFGFGPLVMKSTKVCTYCGQMIKVGLKSCPECNRKLPKETLFDRYKRSHKSCEHCDTVLSDDSNYCPNCGRPVSKGAYEKEVASGLRSPKSFSCAIKVSTSGFKSSGTE